MYFNLSVHIHIVIFTDLSTERDVEHGLEHLNDLHVWLWLIDY